MSVMTAGRTVPQRYRGLRVRDGVAEFRGIPYATADRWSPAQAPAPSDRVIDARRPGPLPPQPDAPRERRGSGGPLTLTLTVRAPWPPGPPRPVLVWLCVAGNVVGRDDLPPYDDSTLPEAGIVQVTVLGRLGPFGFSPLPDVADNRAVSDWLRALEWVRATIREFGGDPDAVTLGGQSAGGGGAMALLASQRARGLFRRAILMSATTPSTDRATARARTEQFAEGLGVAATAAALEGVDEDVLLAHVAETFGPRWRVSDPVGRVRNMIEGPPFRIVDDPDLDVGAVERRLSAGAGDDVTVLAGAAHDEFVEPFGALDVSAAALGEALDLLAPGGARRAADYLRRHPDPARALGAAFTDAVFRLAPRRLAAARGPAAAPTYLYETGPFRGGPPAGHGIDLPAALGGRGSLVPAEAGARITRSWTRFALTGDPGWSPWHEAHEVRALGTEPGDRSAALDELAEAWGPRGPAR